MEQARPEVAPGGGADRVDPFPRQELVALADGQIRGREPQGPAPSLAVDHDPLQRIRPAQPPPGHLDIALGQRLPDPGGRDRLAVHVDRRDDVDPEPQSFAESPKRVGAAGSVAPEPVIVADDQLTQAEARQQDIPDELLGKVPREGARELQEDRVIEARQREGLLLLIGRGQQPGRGLGPHDRQGMRVEGDQHRDEPLRRGLLAHAVEHGPMAAVQPVERPDGDRGPLPTGRQAAGRRVGRAHRWPKTFRGRNLPSRQRTTAITEPS